MTDAVQPPDARLTSRRWVPQQTLSFVEGANTILLQHGAVSSTTVYPARHKARWRAQKLIRLMVELGLHERWELSEHTDQKDGGWMWTVEYLGGSHGRSQ